MAPARPAGAWCSTDSPIRLWVAASGAVAGVVAGALVLISTVNGDWRAQAQSPAVPVDQASLWAAVSAHRQARLAGAPDQATAIVQIAAPAEPLAVPMLVSLALDGGPVETNHSDDLIPDLSSLYAGAEGPGDAITEDGNDVRMMTVQRGDTLKTILRDAGARPEDVNAALKALTPVFNPRLLRQGQRVTVELKPEALRPLLLDPEAAEAAARAAAEAPPVADDTRQLVALTIKPGVEREITVRMTPEGTFAAAENLRELFPRDYHAAGTINASLIGSTAKAGVPQGVASEFAQLFAYDVDFQRDLSTGDSFRIFYTRYFDEMGDPVKDGEILYGSLDLGDRTLALYRFQSPVDGSTDYYDATGASARKFLLRTPVEGARMSSGFGMRRHPILGYSKMHKGVDFAAPTGTPIMAAGNGTIDYIGPKGAFGNYIRIRHNGEYQTAYAHLSKFYRGLRVGSKVRQGQIIGYVGSTGRSTGPHLHYEVLIAGKQVNPATVKSGTNQKLEGSELAEFLQEKARIDALINGAPGNGPIASAYGLPGSTRMR